MIEERSRSVNDDRLNDDRLFLAGSDENGGNPDIMMILLSSVSSSSDVKQKRFVMPIVYEDNRAVPSTLINAPNVSNVANGFSKRPHLRIARLVFFLEIDGGRDRDSYVTGAGTNFIRVVTAAKYFALSSALYSHTISCVDIVKVKLKESSKESERTLHAADGTT